MLGKAVKVKNLLIKYGYEKAEAILNEFNFIIDWATAYKQSLIEVGSVKGMGFTMSVICGAQSTDAIDMLMYYDTCPSAWCGPFDFYTASPRKPYYVFYWYGKFYDMEKYVKCDTEIEDVYTLCGVDKEGKSLAIVCYYKNEDLPNKTITLDFGKDSAKYEIYAVDKDNNGELIKTTEDLTFDMPINSMILVKEI